MNVNDHIQFGIESQGMANLIGVVQYDNLDKNFWAIFEKPNGEFYRKKAIVDTRVSISKNGPHVEEDIIVSESNIEISQDEKERIKKSIQEYGNLELLGEGEINVELGLTNSTIWVAKDKELEHLIDLKRRFEECPLMYSLEREPYRMQHDINQFERLLLEERESRITNGLQYFGDVDTRGPYDSRGD